jgi:hypothetical protein
LPESEYALKSQLDCPSALSLRHTYNANRSGTRPTRSVVERWMTTSRSMSGAASATVRSFSTSRVTRPLAVISRRNSRSAELCAMMWTLRTSGHEAIRVSQRALEMVYRELARLRSYV